MNVAELIKIIDKYSLDIDNRPWVVCKGDIVINHSRWRKIKKQLRNQIEREAQQNGENKKQTE